VKSSVLDSFVPQAHRFALKDDACWNIEVRATTLVTFHELCGLGWLGRCRYSPGDAQRARQNWFNVPKFLIEQSCTQEHASLQVQQRKVGSNQSERPKTIWTYHVDDPADIPAADVAVERICLRQPKRCMRRES
jgi:hypothetical protein